MTQTANTENRKQFVKLSEQQRQRNERETIKRAHKRTHTHTPPHANIHK